jgi:hypothetical protein
VLLQCANGGLDLEGTLKLGTSRHSPSGAYLIDAMNFPPKRIFAAERISRTFPKPFDLRALICHSAKDSGPTQRKHIFVETIEDIGKEADKWDEDEPLGTVVFDSKTETVWMESDQMGQNQH